MSTGATIATVLLFLAMDAIIVGAVMYAAGSTLRDLAQKFPSRPPHENAIRKEFQSFRIDMLGLGLCVHTTVDDECLHMEFARLIRIACKAAPISIPWSAIKLEPVRNPRRGTRVAKVGYTRIVGPAWCLRLADPTMSENTPNAA